MVLLVLSGLTLNAQNKKQPFMPREGYWVIETNIKSPKVSTVYFYTNDAILVYKEDVKGKRLNPRRKKIVMKLNHVLVESITAWNQEQVVKENTMLVKNKL